MNYWPRPVHRFDLRSLTTQQLLRLHCRAWERMTRYSGYQPFGYDARTLWMTDPGFMVILASVGTEVTRRLHA